MQVAEKEVRKFLKKAKVSFLGHTEGLKQSPSKRWCVSRNKNIVTNGTDKDITFTFHKCAQDTTIAQLTTAKGFRIGVAALVGGGVGAQGGVAMGGGYSKRTESMEQSSHANSKNMSVQVNVGVGESVVAVETDYRSEYETECEFDIAINHDYEIECTIKRETKTRVVDDSSSMTRGKPEKKKIRVTHLQREDDESDDEEDVDEIKLKKKLVHLHRICRCKLVTFEHELKIIKHKTDKGKSEQTCQ